MKTNLLCLLALICSLASARGQPESTNIWTGDEAKLYAYVKDTLHAPDDIALAIMFARDKHDIEARRIALMYPKGLTPWSGSPQAPYLAKMNDIYDERRMKLRAIMGSELDTTLVKNDAILSFRWGNLTDAEIVNVKRVHERYDSIMAHNRPFSGRLDKAVFDWDSQYQAAFEKDIQRVLGLKADDFLTFNSPVSKVLENELAAAQIEVDEPTFRRLLTETRALRAELTNTIQTMTVPAARLKQIGMYHVVLGPDKALAIALHEDPVFGRLNAIASGEPGVRLQFYFDYLAIQDRMASIVIPDPFNPTPEATAQMKEQQVSLFALIKASVPADKLDAFAQTREGRFVKRMQDGP